MRILHVNKFLYRRGGAEAYMLDVAGLQERRGHEVAFFAMRHTDNIPSTYAGSFPSQVDLDPPPPSASGKVAAVGRILWSTSAARGIGEVLDRFRPDIVHLHNIYHQLSPSILQPVRRRRVAAVMTLHDYKLVCPTYRFLDHGEICEACLPRRFWNAPLRRCNADSLGASALSATELTLHRLAGAYGVVQRFICPSRFLERKMREGRAFPDRLRWLPNFVDVSRFAPRTEPGSSVVFAGRLSPEKGVDVLLRAVATVPDVPVEIAGDGPAADDLSALASSLGLADRVRFLGRLPSVEVDALLRRAIVAVVPSRWHENMPLSVLEAFAAGVPVIATDLGGLPELITAGEDGMIVPADDPGALASALAQVAGAPGAALVMGARARAKAMERYTAELHLERLSSLYDEAMAARG
jgi:glycosyltransferase involved in cell wall biosynthesis